jgi:hypothetical protein
MIRTNILKVVRRKTTHLVSSSGGPSLGSLEIKEVLQQWWEGYEIDLLTGRPVGEWRDVPVGDEE